MPYWNCIRLGIYVRYVLTHKKFSVDILSKVVFEILSLSLGKTLVDKKNTFEKPEILDAIQVQVGISAISEHAHFQF